MATPVNTTRVTITLIYYAGAIAFNNTKLFAA